MWRSVEVGANVEGGRVEVEKWRDVRRVYRGVSLCDKPSETPPRIRTLVSGNAACSSGDANH